MSIDVDELAQEIRHVDGEHKLGAGQLAEALMPFLSRRTAPAEPVAVKPLEWDGDKATTPFGVYRIYKDPDGYVVSFNHDEFAYVGFESGGNPRDVAKEFADNLYTTGIRSALATPTVSDEMVERATKAALKAIIVPFENGARGAIGENGTTLIDYVEINAASAVELGTVLTEKTATGAPRFHWYSDIANDELESAVENLATPIVRAALLAVLGGHHD